MRKTLLTTALAGILAIGVGAGCGSDDSSQASGDADGSAVSLSSPTDGSVVESTFTATVDLDQFMLSPESVNMAAMEGEGHLHFSLDEGAFDSSKYSGANGDLAEQLGTDGMYSPSTTASITYTGIPAGDHTLKVWLANNDHSDTGISDTVTFTVE